MIIASAYAAFAVLFTALLIAGHRAGSLRDALDVMRLIGRD